jgi:hypothetical protein
MRLVLGLDWLGGDRLAFLAFLALDDLDTHLAEHGHHVLNLLGAVLLRREDGVQLVEGDVAAFLALRDQPLDRAGLRVERGFGIGVRGGCLGRRSRLGCHHSHLSAVGPLVVVMPRYRGEIPIVTGLHPFLRGERGPKTG